MLKVNKTIKNKLNFFFFLNCSTEKLKANLMIYHPVWNSALQGKKERKHMLENYLPLLLNFCSSINCIIGIQVPEDYLYCKNQKHI